MHNNLIAFDCVKK